MIIQFLANRTKLIAWILWLLIYMSLVTPSLANKLKGEPAIVSTRVTNDSINLLSPYHPEIEKRTNAFSFANPSTSNSTSKQKNNTPRLKEEEALDIGGPDQPEMQSFRSVNAGDMVDLFSGDFSYNIPLLDVGGYPLNLHYQSGTSMDQEASWVGSGWNINPGVISRNMRGLPDDFNGDDKVSKIVKMKENKTTGVTAGANAELLGKSMKVNNVDSRTGTLGFSLGVFYNTYKGWGTETGINAGINSGTAAKGPLSAGLALTNNSQEGFDISPSFSARLSKNDNQTQGRITIGTNYNSRMGIQSFQISGEVRKYNYSRSNNNALKQVGTGITSYISFANPSFTPSMTVPFTSRQFAFTAKVGFEAFAFHPSFFVRGYGSNQFIKDEDTLITLPSFGYLYYQKAKGNQNVLLDFNREKDVQYREKTPHIAIPVYTHDTYSISGEGTGGMFRPYRGDLGYVHDHTMSTKSESSKFSLDLGFGSEFHVGVDFNGVYASTSNNPWLKENALKDVLAFREADTTFEAVYFKNPGEKTSVNSSYFKKLGDDNIVRANLSPQNGQNHPLVYATRYLNEYKNGLFVKRDTLTLDNTIRKQRDKRKQTISYLTALEGRQAALDTVIKSYFINNFPTAACNTNYELISRTDQYRKAHHISEMTVLGEDGRRYIYGIPVYNLGQHDVSFSTEEGNDAEGLVEYNSGGVNPDNSTKNNKGKDNFYNREILPPFAHSYLLTNILSPDYVDLKGDGVTEDDLGDGIKFNYSRIYGYNNPYKWRAPFAENKASYNPGLKTDNRDERGSYSYGEKEVWHLNSVESKTMIATFVLDVSNPRKDGYAAKGENGGRSGQTLYRLKEINLYSKADYVRNGTANAKPIKTVHFEYKYELCKGFPGSLPDSGKLTLKKVWFSYNKNNKGQRNAYVFSYHSNNPDYASKSYDRWGNYKNADNNPGVDGDKLSNSDFPYSLQGDSTTAAFNAGAWNLTEIKLPSGGKINVTYESDDYAYVQNKRAMQLFSILGLGATENGSPSNNLYLPNKKNDDYLYVYVEVPKPVQNKLDVYHSYLHGVKHLYFKLFVRMPDTDNWGSGYEFVPVYAEIEDYGIRSSGSNHIWIKVKAEKGESPFAMTAMQFLRLNLPSKAYPASEPGDNLSFKEAVTTVFSAAWNAKTGIIGFGKAARGKNWCNEIFIEKSFIRLNNPYGKKLGGGLRVKKIELFDNWQAMTGKSDAVYGQTYKYTTTENRNGTTVQISSGVASYEPIIGNDENPFKIPIDYVEKIALLAPTNNVYTEEPFGETFFPSPSVGYSKVRVQTIHATKKSADGFTETEYYTTKDFPTRTEFTPLDGEGKKTYNPLVNNFLKFNAKHFVTLSQGFKVELNDMNGKLKSQASFAQNNLNVPISSTHNYYRVENESDLQKRLSGKVAVMDSTTGRINTDGEIGKDIEIMIDLREQVSTTFMGSIEGNVDVARIFPPIIIPSFIPLPSFETNQFRSVAILKVVNRYGILDSVVQSDKGSIASTRNLVFDAETGDVVLSRTNNEFDDPVYNFSYPAHWAYSGMEPAYKNVQSVFSNTLFKRGKLYYPNQVPFPVERYFESGDEILALVQDVRWPHFSSDTCSASHYQFFGPFRYKKLWAIEASKGKEKDNGIFFIDREGTPFSGNASWLKIIRSGKRNLVSTAVGSITSLKNPWKEIGGVNRIVIDTSIGVIATGAAQFKDVWPIDNILKQIDSCVTETYSDSTTLYPTNTAIQYNRTGIFTPSAAQMDFSKNKIVAGYQRFGSTNFAIRSIIKFDFSGIPSNSLISSAKIDLYGVAPRNLFNRAPWNESGFNYSYEGIREAFDGYLLRYPLAWDGHNSLPWLNSSFLDIFSFNKATLPYAGNYNGCVDYTNIQCASLIQDIIQRPPYLQNIMLKTNKEGYTDGGGREIRFMSFGGSQVNTKLPGACFPEYVGACNWNCPVRLRVWYNVPFQKCFKVCVSEIEERDRINPYVFGIFGNWRLEKSFSYYDRRKESDPAVATNIRKDGEIKDFAPFWTFATKYLKNAADTTRWVWNAESRIFNRKGFEIENRDPLGRYNSGQYGYNQTLPVAVTQNSKQREMVFEGFEDFDYQTDTCVKCQSPSWIDHRIAGGSRVTELRHTGKYSLKVDGNQNSLTTVAVGTLQQDTTVAQMSVAVDSIASIKTTVTGKGTGLRTRYGIWLAFYGLLNTCAGQSITNRTVWYGSTELGNINKIWGDGKPAQVCASDYFAAEWSGKIQPRYTELYTIYTRSDDRMRVWINGRLVSKTNAWAEQNGSIEYSDTITLQAGRLYDILVEYQEIKGGARAHLSWSSNSQAKEIIPLSQLYPPTVTTSDTLGSVISDTTWCVLLSKPKAQGLVRPIFSPLQGSKMLVGAWVREEKACADGQSYTNTRIRIVFNNSGTTTYNLTPKGNIIEGWQRIEDTLLIPQTATEMKVYLESLSSPATFFDDVRFHPFNANMKSFVYNPGNIRLMAELDENNYATFYEYDDDGTLIRLKRETYKGVKTIKETRSALIKD